MKPRIASNVTGAKEYRTLLLRSPQTLSQEGLGRLGIVGIKKNCFLKIFLIPIKKNHCLKIFPC